MGIKETVRSRETGERRESVSRPRNVTGLVRSLTEDRPKPKAKEQEVLDVASAYFLKHGYQGASINEMSRSSGISKESIYRYFSSKKQLFEAVIGRELIEYQEKLRRLDSTLPTMDLRETLVTIAETVLGLLLTDRSLALRRLIFDEAKRSPDVGQHYYKIGPEEAYAALEKVFSSHGADQTFDAATLSRYFLSLISWRIVLERECGIMNAPSRQETHDWVKLAVNDFMRSFMSAR